MVVSITPGNAFLIPNDARTGHVLHIGSGSVTLDSGVVINYPSSWWGPFLGGYPDNLSQVYLDTNGSLQSRSISAAKQNSFPANSVPWAIVKTDALTTRIQSVTDARGLGSVIFGVVPVGQLSSILGLW
jgi:hypothetical protein